MKKLAKITVLCVCMVVVAQFSLAQEAYTLGVIAPKGIDVAKTEWQPTLEYLAAQTGKTFRLVPLQFKSFEPAVKSGKMDFIFCNPSVFSHMMDKYAARPLASLVEVYQGKPLRGSGAVIFTAAGN